MRQTPNKKARGRPRSQGSLFAQAYNRQELARKRNLPRRRLAASLGRALWVRIPILTLPCAVRIGILTHRARPRLAAKRYEGCPVFSNFFIQRPIFASVLSIFVTLAGGIALFGLPIAQYPDITPPTVEVS